ncbi:MAG: hypothetical protein M3Q98_05355 [Actinomycetota bacterium]|nr:hypothetical protein [Actinomycetota bacterium]
MSDPWNQLHDRRQVLRVVLDDVRQGRSSRVAVADNNIHSEFENFGDFLLDVYAIWTRAFDARLDALLAVPPVDMAAAVEELRSALDAELPAVRTILDDYADDPALAFASARHSARTKAATGVELKQSPITHVAAVSADRQHRPIVSRFRCPISNRRPAQMSMAGR